MPRLLQPRKFSTQKSRAARRVNLTTPHLQPLQRSTSPDFTIHTPHLPGYRHGGMENGVRHRRVNFQIKNLVWPRQLT
jgi:hypothetical protein